MARYALLLLLLDEDDEHLQRRQTLRSLRDDSDPFSLAEIFFISTFRLPKAACQYLLETLYQFDEQQTSLPFIVRLFSCLHLYGHSSYQRSIATNYLVPMSQSSISRYINYISVLITKHLCTHVTFPITNAEQLATKTRFFTKFGMKGTIGAIDGTHISIVCPPSYPGRACSMYMNRKGYYSLNVEAVCDDNLRILAINPKFPGSCHDSGIWTTSPVRAYMCMIKGSWLLGDQGYPLEPWLMTPVANEETANERKYNRFHCKARNVVERCFGLLKSRFRCLLKHRTLHYKPETAAMIVNTCSILHNIMVVRYSQHEVEIIDTEEDDDDEIAPQSQGNLHREARRIRDSIINNI